MANVLIFNQNQEPQYLQSVNTGDYVTNPQATKDQLIPKTNVLINPDVSSLSSVPTKYWKKQGNQVVEMSTQEKKAIDDKRKEDKKIAVESYNFEGGRVVEALVDAGIVTKKAITDLLIEKEGIF